MRNSTRLFKYANTDPSPFATTTYYLTRIGSRIAALGAWDGNKAQAARSLGIQRRLLYAKMAELNIEQPSE